jgi:hypothetical protein
MTKNSLSLFSILHVVCHFKIITKLKKNVLDNVNFYYVMKRMLLSVVTVCKLSYLTSGGWSVKMTHVVT